MNNPKKDWPKRKFGNPLETCGEIKSERHDRVEKLAIPVMRSFIIGEQLQTEPELAAEDSGILRLGTG